MLRDAWRAWAGSLWNSPVSASNTAETQRQDDVVLNKTHTCLHSLPAQRGLVAQLAENVDHAKTTNHVAYTVDSLTVCG